MEVIEKSVDDLINMYNELGNSNYIGEKITQIEHAVQCALLAQNEKLPKEVVVAALLHDIGHIIGQKYNFETMGEFGVKNHDTIGGKVLRKIGMCEQVCDLVENHVKVKRYLVYTDEDYYNSLSDASKQTLIFQGGKLSKEEVEEYEKNPNLELYIKLRKFDEKAKVENMTLPKMIDYRDLILECFY